MKYSKELKIGVFVVVILTLSFFVINYLRGEDIMNKEIEVISSYENVEGLVASAPVYIKGYKAGKVSEVTYNPESGDFKVVCSVRKEFKMPEDSRMTIYAVDIMGGKGVKIDLGVSEVYVQDGGYLQPAVEQGLMDGLAAEIGPLLSKVTATIDSLGVTISGVNRVLTEQNTDNISHIIESLEKTMYDVRKLASLVEGRSADVEEFISNLSILSTSLTGIAEKVDTSISGVNTMVATLNESDLDGAVESLKSLLEDINNPGGTVGKLLHEDSVYNSVDSLLMNVDVLVKKIQENPKKYIKISVF